VGSNQIGTCLLAHHALLLDRLLQPRSRSRSRSRNSRGHREARPRSDHHGMGDVHVMRAKWSEAIAKAQPELDQHGKGELGWRKDHHKGSARALPMWKCEKMREYDKQGCAVQARPRPYQRGRKGRKQRVIAKTRPKPCQHGRECGGEWVIAKTQPKPCQRGMVARKGV
jgi:hypothetical protein